MLVCHCTVSPAVVVCIQPPSCQLTVSSCSFQKAIFCSPAPSGKQQQFSIPDDPQRKTKIITNRLLTFLSVCLPDYFVYSHAVWSPWRSVNWWRNNTDDEEGREAKNLISSSELHKHSSSLAAMTPPDERRSLWVDKKKIVALFYFVFSHYLALAAESFTSSNEYFMCFIAPCFFGFWATDKKKLLLHLLLCMFYFLTIKKCWNVNFWVLFQGSKSINVLQSFFHFAGLDLIQLHVCDENTPLLLF